MRYTLFIACFLAFVIGTVGTVNQPHKIVPKDHSLKMLSSIINAECSNCDEFEQYLIGSVVINRMSNKDWPNGLNNVVNQENQFHGVNTKQFKSTEETVAIATNLLNGIGVVPDIYYFCLTTVEDKPMDTILIKGTYHYFGK